MYTLRIHLHWLGYSIHDKLYFPSLGMSLWAVRTPSGRYFPQNSYANAENLAKKLAGLA